MPDFRCHFPDLGPNTERIVLSPFESHHLVKTNRARTGDAVMLFNGYGIQCDASLKIADPQKAVLLADKIHVLKPRKFHSTLAIALPKGKAFDTLLRQSTELGVSRIQPLLSDRVQVHWKNSHAKLKRWKAQLIEACKQSGNPWIPELTAPISLDQFLQKGDFDNAFVASLESHAKTLARIPNKNTATLFVGPEGDFSPDEYASLRQLGVQPIRLGRYVMKVETAAICGLAQIMLAAQPE